MKKGKYNLKLTDFRLISSENLFLTGIVLLAFILRMFQINLPVINDEAEFGYSAYSIMKTGKNQYNQSNYLLFTTPYNDRYPTIYSFSTIPFIKLFGLNEVTERLPSVLFGTFSCVLLYVLVKQLFHTVSGGLVSALLMAINPWSLYYSRQGRFEMIGIFLVLTGIVCFIYAINTKHIYQYILSSFGFGMSMLANDATKIVVPLLISGLIFLFRNKLRSKKRYMLVYFGICLFFAVLVLKVLFIDHQIDDFIRQSPSHVSAISEIVNFQRRQTVAPLWVSSIFHNKITVFTEQYLSSFLNIYSLNWFFHTGAGMLQESIGRFGQYLLFELPFFFIGVYLSFRKKIIGIFLLYWMLIANIPGAITSGGYYSYRSIMLLPVPLIYSGLGIVWFWKKLDFYLISKPGIKNGVRIVFVISCILYTCSFLFSLYFDYPVYASEYRSKQRIDALRYARSVDQGYEKIYVAGRFEVAYSFITKLDPRIFQDAYSKSSTYKNIPVINLGKYTFGLFPMSTIATPSAYFSNNSLIIADNSTVQKSVPILKKFVGTEPLNAVYVAFEVK